MQRIVILIAGLILTVVAQCAAGSDVPKSLKACGDIGEFPPYSYYAKDAEHSVATVTGFDIDYLNALFALSDRHVTYELLPWKRCLTLVASGQIDLVLDIAKTPERERDYQYSNFNYTLTPIYIASKSHRVPKLEAPDDFAKYRICQPLGWDYTLAGLPLNSVTVRPYTLDSAVKMLKLGRCDAFLINIETLDGLRRIGKGDFFDDSDLTFTSLPWFPKVPLYTAVSRAVPYRDELVQLINHGIEQFDKTSDAMHLRETYLKTPKPTK